MVIDDVDFSELLNDLKRFGDEFQIDFTGQPVKLTADEIIPLEDGFCLPFKVYKLMHECGLVELRLNEEDVLTRVKILKK